MTRITTLLLLTVLTLAGCKKESDQGPVTLKVLLTDNPVNAEKVNVDIREVRVKFTDDDLADENWTALETTAGIYNLLALQNGVTTPLAQGTLPSRNVKEIRLVLGTDNSIVVNGDTYDLVIPSGSSSGLKIKIAKPLRNSVEEIVIDFDAALSISQTGAGQYMLKPVLRIK